MIRTIDAHLHLWRLSRGDYGWITDDLVPLRRDFEPADARAELVRAGVAGAILVQAAPTIEETRFLLKHAEAHDWLEGVVGWVDLEARDAPEQIARLAEHPKLKGIRPMIQDIPDPAWMLRPTLTPALRAVSSLDLAFDALVTPRHLDHLQTLLDRHPELRVVIDHGAKPVIAQGAFTSWAAGMSRLGRASAAFCKLSGLVTEAGPDWTSQRLRPYVDHVLETFGPDRLVFGSDWPVVTLASDYRRWITTARALLGELGADDQARIFGGNAASLYRLS